MTMRRLGEIEFEFEFRAQQGRTWPRMIQLVNNMTMGYHEITAKNNRVRVRLEDWDFNRGPNNISFAYFSKNERETVVQDGKIVADQSLELISIHADDILLEPWFWTEHWYRPEYFAGYLRQNPDAPQQLRSQLIWHFPGRYTITGLPRWSEFWSWYQEQRTERVLSGLIDPTGQIRDNHRSISDEDRRLIAEIKEVLNV